MKITIHPGGVVSAEPNSFGGDDDGSEWEKVGPRAHFKDQAEMVAAMRKPQYKTSKSYREVVKQIIAQSDPVALGLAPDRSHIGEAEYEQAKMQTVRELFSDPRYKYDARYRNEVRKICQSELADQHFSEYSEETLQRRASTHRLEAGYSETGMIDPNSKRDENGDLKE